MSAYAILGATGQVGGSILHILGENLDNKINVLVRSRSKLEHCYPSVVSNKNIRVFEGPVSDTQTLAACVRDARVVFLCVAVKGNAPGFSIYDDLARAETYMRQHEDWLDMTSVLSQWASTNLENPPD
ncbi:hypothetical protein E8E11_000287 [Didymella keratinophila]|nr:hypothetical protein E8E11_000287 [Didymella keratinophila]